MSSHLNFQYCPKLIVLSSDRTKVLLCKRYGEADYDGIFSFPGGKMENTDPGLTEGVNREKDEELGADFKVKLLTTYTHSILWRKKAGDMMVLPHMLCIHDSGEISLNTEEYSEYQWVSIAELENFEPIIPNIPEIVQTMLRLMDIAKESDYVII